MPIDRRVEASAAAAASDLPSELTCRYKSSRCLQPRSQKRNGQLHNYCALHRERANANQRRLEAKKRSGQQKQPGQLSSESKEDNQQDRDDSHDFQHHEDARTEAYDDEVHTEMFIGREVPTGAPQIPLPEPLQVSDSPQLHPPVYEWDPDLLDVLQRTRDSE
ncbi:hypothetical protein BBJ28_00025869 [Nothophytophthora sp. Chile5]|nr:hypothetical protein BBJ28_00025869 [Nothophytophthora sp. Chile5]